MQKYKKCLEITGSLIFPIEVGHSAFVREASGIRRTSKVLSTETLSPTEIQFETNNTIYCLHLAEQEAAL